MSIDSKLSTLVDDLTEDDALALVTRLKSRFGWAGTVLTYGWAEEVWHNSEWDPFTDRPFSDFVWECVRSTGEFSRLDGETQRVQETALVEAIARVRKFLRGEV